MAQVVVISGVYCAPELTFLLTTNRQPLRQPSVHPPTVIL